MEVTSATIRSHANLAERMARAYAKYGRHDAAAHFTSEAARLNKIANERAAQEVASANMTRDISDNAD